MIHLCTIATLMFLQNNTSQKILFIAARTIQFPGVVFKVCIYLIVAIVTSSIYFDVKSTHTYRKYIYQQSSFQSLNLADSTSSWVWLRFLLLLPSSALPTCAGNAAVYGVNAVLAAKIWKSETSMTSTALMQGAGMARENMEMVIKSMLAMQTRTMAHNI